MNLNKVTKYMKENDIDGWLLYDFESINHITQKILGTKDKAITRRYFYFISSEGKTTLLVHDLEKSKFNYLKQDIVSYTNWLSLKENLKKMLNDTKKIAMEYSPECAIPYISKVDAGTVELIRGFDIEVISSADLIQITESVWNKMELEAHLDAVRKISKIKDESFKLIAHSMKAENQITEFDVQQFILNRFKEDGLETIHDPIVAINENSSDPHYMPTKDLNKPIKKGDIVLIDLWAKKAVKEGIFADITWMGFVGKDVPKKYSDIFSIVAGARDFAIDYLKKAFIEGRVVRGCDIDDIVRNYIDGYGYGAYFIHRTGHSIGNNVHGNGVNIDNFESKDVRKIIRGVGFTIEPGIYLKDFGVRSEINVFIGDNGPMVTTPIQNAIIPLLEDKFLKMRS